MQRSEKQFSVELHSVGSHAEPVQFMARTVSEVQSFVSTEFKPNSVLLVACLSDGVDHGNFIAFLNSDDLAFVRLLSHQGFYAKRPSSLASQSDVQFWEEDGTRFTKPVEATVSKEQALAALKHWLPAQDPTPDLLWEAE